RRFRDGKSTAAADSGGPSPSFGRRRLIFRRIEADGRTYKRPSADRARFAYHEIDEDPPCPAVALARFAATLARWKLVGPCRRLGFRTGISRLDSGFVGLG